MSAYSGVIAAGRREGLAVKQLGLTASYAATTGYGTNVSIGWRFINPTTDRTRNLMHVSAGSSDVVVSHNPALQRNQSGSLAWVSVVGTPVGEEVTEFVPSRPNITGG